MNELKQEEMLFPKKWKGYTLDELRYRRALTSVAIEIEKDRLQRTFAGVLPSAEKTQKGTSIISKALGALSYVDYAILGWRLFKTLKKLRRH